jgi:multimeric flavodoxin WrbA
MKFLVMNASPRKKGNSDVLSAIAIREALHSEVEAAEVIQLRDFNIMQCNGCMRCVFKDERCPLEDDFYIWYDKMASADALFLVAPTYVTTIPGALKVLFDRYLCIPPLYKKLYGKPAISVGVASPIDWEHFMLPFTNMFLLGLGFRILDSFMVYGAGPGEILLDESQISRVKGALQGLWSGGAEQVKFADVVSDHCPVCFSTLFERIAGQRFRCPVCLSEAELTEGGFHFDAAGMNEHRWTPQRMEDHFQNWILQTKGMYREKLKEILRRRREELGGGG